MLGGKCNAVRSIVHYYVKVSELGIKFPACMYVIIIVLNMYII